MTATAFATDRGVTVPAITTDQMREIDRVAIDDVGPNLYQMMENAGRSLALAAVELLGPTWWSQPVLVLAGTGGNGGGGICAARHLANRGADVAVVITDPERLAPVSAAQLTLFRATAGRETAVDDLGRFARGLIIDAVIGYSLSGAPRGVARTLIQWVDGQSAPVLSLDVPSGLDATTGEAPGAVVSATHTMTLALPKTGLDAPEVTDLSLADLGIPAEVFRRVGVAVPQEVFGDRYRVPLHPV